jgi:hypothetical protein
MLWCALIAKSGQGKSPALDFARKPIDMLQMDAWERFKTEREQYEVNVEEYHRLSRVKKPNESIIPVKPAEPVMQRYSVSEFTTESLLPILAENPHGVCLIRDELAAFFNGLDAYKTAKVDRQIFIEIHGGRFVQSDRKTGRAYIAVKSPSVSIIGGIQTDVIRQIIREEPEFLTTGFGARFLMVYPPDEPILWNENVADSTVLQSYEKTIASLLRCRDSFSLSHDGQGIVSLTPEAKKLIFEFQNRHAIDSLGIANGNVRYIENKAGMHCARLALVLHVVECVGNGIIPTSPVTPETMGKAIALTEWFLNEARRVYAMFAGEVESMDDTLTAEQREVMNVL